MNPKFLPMLKPARPAEESQEERTDVTVFYHITKACNLRCRYCYFSASQPLPDEMDTAESIRLCSSFATSGIRKVVFTGGEPLLRRDLWDLLAALSSSQSNRRVRTCLNTNGHLVTPTLARRLVGLVDEVRVSIDGLRDSNDLMRGSGNFDAALSALECLYQAGFEPKALVTVTRASLGDLEELLCLLASRKITRINLNLVRPIGRARNHDDWCVSPNDVRQAFDRAWRRSFPGRRLPPAPEEDVWFNCGVGQFLNIMPSGEVFPCHVLTDSAFSCGNLKRETLAEILEQRRLLAKLKSMDFVALARSQPKLSSLARPGICLGDVYRDSQGGIRVQDLLTSRESD